MWSSFKFHRIQASFMDFDYFQHIVMTENRTHFSFLRKSTYESCSFWLTWAQTLSLRKALMCFVGDQLCWGGALCLSFVMFSQWLSLYVEYRWFPTLLHDKELLLSLPVAVDNCSLLRERNWEFHYIVFCSALQWKNGAIFWVKATYFEFFIVSACNLTLL